MSLGLLWQGKAVWITGGSSGLGLAMARLFCASGANVLLIARNERSLQEAADQCRKVSGKAQVHILAADLSRLDQLEALYARGCQQLAPPDLLINNVGMSQRAFIPDTVAETDRRLFDINYFSPRLLTCIALPDLIARQSSVLTIASMAGRIGSQGRASYAASKGAIIKWMDCLRSEVHDQGVRVIVASPDFMATNLAKSALTGSGETYGKTDAELGHGLSPAAMAEKIVAAMGRGNDDIVLAGAKIRWAERIYRLHPNWYHKIVRKFYKRSF